jgi:molybdopterin-guanine dinucleotide biosynthesis protein A
VSAISISGGRIANVAGALLLGGLSERMGRDKGRMLVGGVPAATRTAALLGALFEEILLVGGAPPEDAVGRRVPDPEGPRCALRGLVAALGAARSERVLVVASDLPALTADVLLALVAWPEADAVVPREGGRLQPLCALYRREVVLAVATEHLGAGRLALWELLDGIELSILDAPDLRAVDPRGHALANANTPEEWARLEALLRQPRPDRGQG